MQGRIYRRAGSLVYWFKYTDHRGYPVEHCTGTHSFTEAEKFAAELGVSAIDPGRSAKNTPAQEAVYYCLSLFVKCASVDRSPSTIECYEQKGGHLVRLLGCVSVKELSVDQVTEYCRKRLDEGAARETVRKELVVLRLTLSHARDRGVLERDPDSVIPKFRARYKPRRRWLSTVELRGLLRHLPPDRQRWVIVAVMTGGRLSEIEGLTWGDLDFANQQIHIRGTKTDRSDRIIPMDRELGELLGQMRKGASEAVAGAWSNVRRDLAKACAKARIDPVSPNDLRRTFASWLKQAGRDSLAVGKLLGHTSSRMVELVYGHLDQKSLRHAMEALPSVHSLIESPSHPTETNR